MHSYNTVAEVGLFAGKLVLYATDICIESCTVLTQKHGEFCPVFSVKWLPIIIIIITNLCHMTLNTD